MRGSTLTYGKSKGTYMAFHPVTGVDLNTRYPHPLVDKIPMKYIMGRLNAEMREYWGLNRKSENAN